MAEEKDIRFISQLRKNARTTLTDLSKKTSIPISTLFDRLRAHEGRLIIKHTTLIDFRELGYGTKAWVAIKTNKDSREALKTHLSLNENVNNIYLINNQYDFLFELVCCNLKEMRDFFDSLEEKFEIVRKQEHLVIEDIEREKFLTNEKLFF